MVILVVHNHVENLRTNKSATPIGIDGLILVTFEMLRSTTQTATNKITKCGNLTGQNSKNLGLFI